MYAQVEKPKDNKGQAVANTVAQKKSNREQSFGFVDNRSEAVAQRKMQARISNSSTQSFQKKENNPGLPDNLKSGIEILSGYSMDDVKVHYNSDKPAQLQVHAYAQGAEIHLASGQEKHLPHEAWHVVQQKQGRVKPTLQLKETVNVNDDTALETEADVMGVKAIQAVTRRQQNPILISKPLQSVPIQRNAVKSVARRGAKGAVGGAVLGGIIGSFVPGVGTLICAGIGAGAGLLVSLIKEGFEAKARRRIAERYGIQISTDISGVILKKIENVLASLPSAHTKGNATLTDVNTEGVGNASVFDGEHTIGINNPALPLPGNLGMPDLLYAMLNKEPNWQRKLMDQGAMPDFDEAVDQAYGLNSDDRHVMAGVSDANSHENLLTWTMRHETGHSVDAQIRWADSMKGQDVFGAWQTHSAQDVFLRLLDKNNIPDTVYRADFQMNPRGQRPLYEHLQTLNHATIALFLATQEWQNFVQNPTVPGDINARVTAAIRSYDVAKNSPWTFDGGGANDLNHNGRIYMRGQYGEWESYLAGTRANAVSNYQFSSAVEWFAEAYAAYYNPEQNAASRARLSAEQRDWFANHLGTHSGDANFNQAAGLVQLNATGELELQ